MKKISFTLMEVLMAMAVVGIIAGATANSLKKVSANKVKTAFQNNYTHMQSTFDKIFSDENIIPATYTGTDSKTGKNRRNLLCGWTYKLNDSGESVADFSVIPEAFKDLTGGIISSKTVGSGQGVGYAFETKNGSYWVVRRNPENMTCNPNDVADITKTDYIVLFDIDGIYSGTNCPYNLSTTTDSQLGITNANCTNPDTFKFGTVSSYKLIPDTKTIYNGQKLENYMISNNLIKSKF